MEKIKLFVDSDKGRDILTVLIVILVGLASFGLGRLSKSNPEAGIKIEYQVPQESNVISSTNGTSSALLSTKTITKVGEAFFASKRGSKYYSIGCSGGKTIKQENRIYFSTEEEAERAGYELSSTCK